MDSSSSLLVSLAVAVVVVHFTWLVESQAAVLNLGLPSQQQPPPVPPPHPPPPPSRAIGDETPPPRPHNPPSSTPLPPPANKKKSSVRHQRSHSYNNNNNKHKTPPPSPSKEKLNLGKKIGLLFTGIIVILQVCVVAFLLVKSRKMFKNPVIH